MQLDIPLLKHQYEFVEDRSHRYVGMVAGYGSGKTQALIFKAIDLAFHNTGYAGVLIEPTNSLVKLILQPKFELVLEDLGIPFSVKQVPVPTYTLHFEQGDSVIMMMSGENYQRHIGYEVAFVCVDEADTIPFKVCSPMVQKLQGRIRSGKLRQFVLVSTPEGFNFMHHFFVKEMNDTKSLIRASTYDNPFLPDDYIPSLLGSYPPQLIEAYLNGQFVNLHTGSIYTSFDRFENHTDISINDDIVKSKVIHIGLDFNVNNMSAVCAIVDNSVAYVFHEITKKKDTQEMIDIIKRTFPGKTIFIYPDSSGKAEKSNSSRSDITQLKQAGFNVRFPNKNPRVVDRINTVNTKLCNAQGVRTLFVNTNACPQLTESLEKQSYTTNGDPDKSSGFDHTNDAVGYFICFAFPMVSFRTRVFAAA